MKAKRSMKQPKRRRVRRQIQLVIRPYEDSVEIACCLFNRGLLSVPTIDKAVDEIETWIRELAKQRHVPQRFP